MEKEFNYLTIFIEIIEGLSFACILYLVFSIDILNSKQFRGIMATLLILILIGLFITPIFILLIDEDTRLVQGHTRQTRKLNRKLLKLKAQKNEFQNKKETEEEISKVKCQIKGLELEIQNKLNLCCQCNTKIPYNAKFCPNCGTVIREVKA